MSTKDQNDARGSAPSSDSARVKKHVAFFTAPSCLVMLLGLFLAGIILIGMGLVLGLVPALLVFLIFAAIGNSLLSSWVCSACGNPVANKKVRMCPTCRAELS